MSNVRFATTNHAVAPPTIIVGTPPADAAFPAANMLDPDRYTLWRTTAAPGAFQVILDLGSAKSVAVAGLLNHVPLAAAGVVTCDVYSSTISNAGAWTLRGTISPAGGAAADSVVTFGATSARWWLFDLTSVTAGFTLGKLLLSPVTDLGLLYSPGMTETRARHRARESSISGIPFIMEMGLARRRWEMAWHNIDATTRATIVALAALGTSWVYLDPSDIAFEVDLADDMVQSAHLWNLPPVYDISLHMEQLP